MKITRKALAFAFALFVLSSLAFASQLTVTSPVEQKLSTSGEVLDLGAIGPGQTLEVVADWGAGQTSLASQSNGEALWDQLFVVRSSLPSGWKAEDSKLFELPFHAFVTASPTATDGEYSFQLRVMDQYDGAGERTFNAKVRVAKDLFEQEVSPDAVTTGVGLPAVFRMKLRNKSSASDVFQINASGVPGGWKETRKVLVKFRDEVIVDYEILPGEQGEYSVLLQTTSLSSSLIHARKEVTLVAVSSLEQDLRALGRGILLVPTVEQVVYSALSVVSYFLYR